MPNYTKEQIEAAIEALEIFGNQANDVLTPGWVVDEASDLAYDAWFATEVTDGDVYTDALEAAARLREGKLPGTPERDL